MGMASQFLRPTRVKGQKRESGWRIKGEWGERRFPPMSKVELYRLLHRELIASCVLPADSPAPSNRYHGEVTMTIPRCSWIEGRWVVDTSSAAA
jgi:hypothetical protein